MSTRRRRLALAWLLGPALVAGCGFHLRGPAQLPAELSPLYVQGPPNSLVVTQIQEQVAGGGITLATDPAKARLILRIQTDQRRTRVVATDLTGKILASELQFALNYDAVKQDGTQFIPLQTLELTRTFDNANVQVLGKQLEEAQLFREFAVDAADRILLRLRTALQRGPT